jgi:hypothetical protein
VFVFVVGILLWAIIPSQNVHHYSKEK